MSAKNTTCYECGATQGVEHGCAHTYDKCSVCDKSLFPDIYALTAFLGHGMINVGNHRGVMVGLIEHIGGCPRGWVFIESKDATRDSIREACEFGSKLLSYEKKARDL